MFFTYLSSSNMPANALQREAADLLERRSNLLILGSVSFLDKLKQDVARLNRTHPRCTPLELHTWGVGDGSIGVSLGERFTVGFYLYPVRNPENAKPENLSN